MSCKSMLSWSSYFSVNTCACACVQYNCSWCVYEPFYAHRYFEVSVDCTLDLPAEMNDARYCKPHYSHSCNRLSLPVFTLKRYHLTHLHLQCSHKMYFMTLLQSVWFPPRVNLSSFINSKKNNTFWAAAKIRTVEESDICFMFITGGV